VSGRRPRALPPEKGNKKEAPAKKPRFKKEEVRGYQTQQEPGGDNRTPHGEPKKEHVSERDCEEGEVRAPTGALVPHLGRIGQGANIDSRGICLELILGILKTATRIFAPEEEGNALEQLAIEAIINTEGNYGIREAVKWADGFEFPQELVDSDLRLFRASALDFTKMVDKRLKKIGTGSLSTNRVEQLRPDNPERSRLFDIAKGMKAPLPEGFKPNAKGVLSPLRPAYLEVHQAVDKMLADLHGQGMAFCLPKKEAIQLIDGLHLGKASWTPKKGKASGRSGDRYTAQL
jgi:hypothetical protein